MIDKRRGSITSLATELVIMQDGIPDVIRRAFRRTVGHATCMEQMLWREVAARMTLDALGITPEVITVRPDMDKAVYTRYAKAVNEARDWFTRKQRDSELVFELAGVESAQVRPTIEALAPLAVPKCLRLSKPRPGRINSHARIAA